MRGRFLVEEKPLQRHPQSRACLRRTTAQRGLLVSHPHPCRTPGKGSPLFFAGGEGVDNISGVSRSACIRMPVGLFCNGFAARTQVL